MAIEKEWADRICWRTMGGGQGAASNCITRRCTAFWMADKEQTRFFHKAEIPKALEDGWVRLTGESDQSGQFRRLVPDDERQCDCAALPVDFVCGFDNQ